MSLQSPTGAAPLSVAAAQAAVVSAPVALVREDVALADAHGRVTASDIVAPRDVPPHACSAMDGYAVRAADVAQAASELPIALFEVGSVRAGEVASARVHEGEALRIMTGAPLPAGADAVVMIEHTRRDAIGGRVFVTQSARAGDHVRRAGEDIARGDVVVAAGTRIDAPTLGVLASLEHARVAVYRRPVVAILSTGDELRTLDEPARPGSIVESNSHVLAALVTELGAIARVLPIAKDEPATLRARFAEASNADVVLSTGGVSVGDHDHVKAVLDSLGARWRFWRVAMKPGKPVAVADVGNCLWFGLPGNPVSAVVGFYLFVRPALRQRVGLPPFDLPEVAVRLTEPVSAGDRRSYLRANVFADGAGELWARPKPRQGSGVLSSLLSANALVIVEPGATAATSARALLLSPIAMAQVNAQ